MNCKGLFLLVALAMGAGGVVHAQDSIMAMDDAGAGPAAGTWYIAPYVGGYYNDTDRHTNSREMYLGIAVGKFLSPSVSVDVFTDHAGRDRDSMPPNQSNPHAGGNWINNTLGVAVRYYAGSGSVRPYLLVGGMGSHHSSGLAHGWAPAAEVGGGLAFAITDSASLRTEIGYRYDWDNESLPDASGFGDYFVNVGLLALFGQPPPPVQPAPVVQPPAPPPVDCSMLDEDNDGVNNCVDTCAATAAGTIVGPDGCAKPVVIDLRGVNFKFDRPDQGETDIAPTLQEPTAESIAILDQAVDTLTRYPAVMVELDGYTDAIGTEAYNQKLSERRAQIVYGYLTTHGIDASRIVAVKGFGESHPVAPNDTAEGRARNRRTELVVQNPNQPAAPESSDSM